jgi:hypothetical protein
MSLTWGHLLTFDSIYPEELPVEFGPHVSKILAQNSSWAVCHAVTWMLCSHYYQQTAAVVSRPLYSHPSCHMHVCGRWWMHRTVWNPIETIGSSAETTCLSDQDFVDVHLIGNSAPTNHFKRHIYHLKGSILLWWDDLGEVCCGVVTSEWELTSRFGSRRTHTFHHMSLYAPFSEWKTTWWHLIDRVHFMLL